MGLGSAMAGGNPSEGRQERDLYTTPEEATVALLRVETFDGVIHEPCSGNDRMVKVLEAHGHKVVASDIHPLGRGVKRDFFSIKQRVGHNIVTNPPFDQAEAMIKHALALDVRKVAFLLKATYWHAATRLPLFETNPPAWIYPLTWRLDFLDKGRPAMECAWFVWHRGVKDYPRVRLLPKPKL